MLSHAGIICACDSMARFLKEAFPGRNSCVLSGTGHMAAASASLGNKPLHPTYYLPHAAHINYPHVATGHSHCRRHHRCEHSTSMAPSAPHFSTAPSPSSSTPSRPTLFIVDGAYPISYTPRRVQWTRRCNNNHRRAGGEY